MNRQGSFNSDVTVLSKIAVFVINTIANDANQLPIIVYHLL